MIHFISKSNIIFVPLKKKKMIREIIKIDEDLCDGCGNCIPGCHEGALQLIDGKARLVSELMCDGLGDCIGHCPQDAIRIERREAEPYDESIIANPIPAGGCPGSITRDFSGLQAVPLTGAQIPARSELTHWPVQMHLINPAAPHYRDVDVLLAADCVAYTVANFHGEYLKDKKLAIACPKLDNGTDIYIDKIRRLIDEAMIRSLHLVVMEVPCCSGLSRMVEIARGQANRTVPVELSVISTRGEVINSNSK